MTILVIGASGRVGQLLTKQLLDQHKVIGTTRQTDALFDHPNYSQIAFDMTKSLAELEAAFPDKVDAVYFVSGSRAKNSLQVDLHGAVKTMQLAEKNGIKRYIMLSAFGSLTPELWHKRYNPENAMMDYYIAKHYADLYLIDKTDLDYTILQPGALTEESGSGKIALKVTDGGANTLANVAATLAAVLEAKNTYKQVLPMHDGDTPIKEAVQAL